MTRWSIGGYLAGITLCAAAPAQTYFPAPSAPAGNPVTQAKALLGMALFWEEQMSSSNTVACGSCHVFSTGGVDPRAGERQHPGRDGVYGTPDDVRGAIGVPQSTASGRYLAAPGFGIEAQVTTRKAPSVINAAYQPTLFYDGRAGNGDFLDPITNQVALTGDVALENLIKGPPVNTTEMGHVGRSWSDVATKIAGARPLALAGNLPPRLATFVGNASTYNELFASTYGSGATATPSRIIMAIATYLRTLVSDQSPYDRYLAGNPTLNAEELRGLQVFSTPHGNAAACMQCHGDLQQMSHSFGPSPMFLTPYGGQNAPNSHNIGIRPVPEDQGVGAITTVATDMGRFRAPGLRNTNLHGTWFHTGAMGTLADVVEFYDRGGDFHSNQATEIQPRNLSTSDKAALVKFLQTLTDPRVANEAAPFDRPRLGSERGLAPTRFGTGSTGTVGRTPRAVALEPVSIDTGRTTLAVANALPNVPAFVMWDTDVVPQGYQYAGVHLYLGLYQFSATFVGVTQAAGDGSGFASLPIALPNNQTLRGFRFYAQWLLADPAAPSGVVTSDATELLLH